MDDVEIARRWAAERIYPELAYEPFWQEIQAEAIAAWKVQGMAGLLDVVQRRSEQKGRPTHD